MFDIGFWELCMIGLVSLLVVGPEKLPKAARVAGFWVGKTRNLVASVKMEIKEELQAEELRQILKEQSELEEVHKLIEESSSVVNEMTSSVETLVNEQVKPVDESK